MKHITGDAKDLRKNHAIRRLGSYLATPQKQIAEGNKKSPRYTRAFFEIEGNVIADET